MTDTAGSGPGRADGPARADGPPGLGRVLVLAAVLLAVMLVVLGVAAFLGGQVFAGAVYIGFVLTAATVRAFPVGWQVASGLWAAAVSAAGVLIGGNIPVLLAAIVAVCLGQAVFTRQSVRVVALSPMILVFYALQAPPAWSALPVTAGTAVGALVFIGIGRLLGLEPEPKPAPWRTALLHGALLATGCCVLLLLGVGLGLERTHWGLLTFCLVFVPDIGRRREGLFYLAGTAVGAVSGALVGLADLDWLTLVVALLCAVLVVAFTLAARPLVAVGFIAATVVLMGTAGADSATAQSLVGQRTGLALAAVLLAVAMSAAGQAIERRSTPTAAPTTPP